MIALHLPPAIAFEDVRQIAAGSLAEVALVARHRMAAADSGDIRIFESASGRLADIDLSGSDAELVSRLTRRAALLAPSPDEAAVETGQEPAPRKGPGRPRLGVVAREVTLLPRHWDWLAAQPGGASVALRRLIDEARRANSGKDIRRSAQDAAYRFMASMAGDFPLYEDANRALFAADAARFYDLTDAWPADVRNYARSLADAAFTYLA